MKTTLVSRSAWCIFWLALMLFPHASHSQVRSGGTLGPGGRTGLGTGIGTGTGTHGVGDWGGARDLTVVTGTWTSGTSSSSYDQVDLRIWDAMRQRAAEYAARAAWARKSR